MSVKKVIVGFSGGVDSSVTAYLLKKQGYEVTGVTFVINNEWHEKNASFALASAKQLGIQHKFMDVQFDFDSLVIESYLNDINCGSTPSPCPLCNKVFKFEQLKAAAVSEGDDVFFATGHYASLVQNSGEYYISRGKDIRKDQSYMLYRLDRCIKEKLLLPLGIFQKSEVRGLARENGIPVCDRGDSQGLCFALDGYESFIQEHLAGFIKPGYFTDRAGNILGVHRGYQLYTIGQRRGLGINFNKPLFVTAIIPGENKIVLDTYDTLFRESVVLKDFVVHGKYKDEYKDRTFTLRPRSSSSGHKGRITIENGIVTARYEKPNAENAPGQHLVVYDGDVVAGGGIITTATF